MFLVRYLLILGVLLFILWLPISYANASTVQFNAVRTSFTGTVLLDGRSQGAHEGTLVRLNGVLGNSYMTYTSSDGSFSFSDIVQDTYVLRLTHPYFLYYVTTLPIFEKPLMPTITLCAGDMDQEGDIDQRDRGILAAGIIPVSFSDYDLNGNGQTNVGDLIVLERNMGQIAPADCSEATATTALTGTLEALGRAKWLSWKR